MPRFRSFGLDLILPTLVGLSAIVPVPPFTQSQVHFPLQLTTVAPLLRLTSTPVLSWPVGPSLNGELCTASFRIWPPVLTHLSSKVSHSLSFFFIKDSYGVTQLVAHRGSDNGQLVLDGLAEIPVESVVLIQGLVRFRPKQAQRSNSPTGQIEVLVENYTLLNTADHRHMPFMHTNNPTLANEDLRARFRHLDLRRPVLSANLRKRSNVVHLVRNLLHQQDFVEVETPLLLKSTPEGAREFLVPTRNSTTINNPGSTRKSETLFYALPQSPQQPKQLLICSGAVDKYYQVARCFRDEDGRKDRQPEFTQIDIEMAFVSWGKKPHCTPQDDAPPGSVVPSTAASGSTWRIGGQEVRSITETLIRTVWNEIEGIQLPSQFQVMTYRDAMNRYGSDKPDTRFGLEISDLTPLLPPCFQQRLATQRGILECLVVRRAEDPHFLSSNSASDHDSTQAVEIRITEKNLPTWLLSSQIITDLLETSSVDSLGAQISFINDRLRISPGDIVWLSRRRDIPEGGSTDLGRVRLRLMQDAQKQSAWQPTSEPHFLWVTEFPLFTRADTDKEFMANGRWSSSHHPFTAPMWEDIGKMFAGEIERVRGQHYDLVLNGMEIGGGSVRVHDPVMQEYIFSEVLKLTQTEQASLDHLLHALKCGAPPHGGIALGLDRLMSVLCKTQTIRDVIAFPKTGAGKDPFFKSPSAVSEQVLAQYGISIR